MKMGEKQVAEAICHCIGLDDLGVGNEIFIACPVHGEYYIRRKGPRMEFLSETGSMGKILVCAAKNAHVLSKEDFAPWFLGLTKLDMSVEEVGQMQEDFKTHLRRVDL